MAGDVRTARDLDLLDAIDGFRREPFGQKVWRLVRSGRDPTAGSPSRSRWCNGSFDVLYTALERDGAIAEIDALLSLQPVFPSKAEWFVSTLTIAAERALRLADLPTLERLGVETARYAERAYARTQEIADAAYFLDFDGLIVPSARWSCLNLVLFTDSIAPDAIQLVQTDANPVDWTAWRQPTRR